MAAKKTTSRKKAVPRKTAAQRAQSAIFKKANQLMREGYGRAQAFAVAYAEKAKKPAPTRKAPAAKKNPVQRKLQSRPKPAGRLNKRVFTVEISSVANGPFKVYGIFPTEAAAREIAHALDEKHEHTKYIRVTV